MANKAKRANPDDTEKIIQALTAIEKEVRELRFLISGELNDLKPKVEFLYQLQKRRG